MFPCDCTRCLRLVRRPTNQTSCLTCLRGNNLPRLCGLPAIRSRGRCITSIGSAVLLHSVIGHGPIHSMELLSSVFVCLIGGTSGLFSIRRVIGFFGSGGQGIDCSALSGCLNCVRRTFLTCGARHCGVGKGSIITNGYGCCLGSLSFGGFLCPNFTCKIKCLLRGTMCLRLHHLNCVMCANSFQSGRISFITVGSSEIVCLRTACVLRATRAVRQRCTPLLAVNSGCRGCIISVSRMRFPSGRKIERVRT